MCEAAVGSSELFPLLSDPPPSPSQTVSDVAGRAVREGHLKEDCNRWHTTLSRLPMLPSRHVKMTSTARSAPTVRTMAGTIVVTTA